MFPGESGLPEAILMAGFGRFEVLSIDYRMSPDAFFPAALDDVVAGWAAALRLAATRTRRRPARCSTRWRASSTGASLAALGTHEFAQLRPTRGSSAFSVPAFRRRRWTHRAALALNSIPCGVS
jgi:hypothetical protein